MSFIIDKNLFSYQVEYNNDEYEYYDNCAFQAVYDHNTPNQKDEGIKDDILREDIEIQKNIDELQEGFYNWSNFTIKV